MARYMNGIGFEILARTPVAQLPPLPPITPQPPRVEDIRQNDKAGISLDAYHVSVERAGFLMFLYIAISNIPKKMDTVIAIV